MIEVFQQILKCKWTLMILDRFKNGMRRPGELGRSIRGLSSKVMYERLKLLEENEIIERELVAEKPLEVHYRLCPSIKYHKGNNVNVT
jgi:DNA-binding HxlR family transcriptional regulator